MEDSGRRPGGQAAFGQPGGPSETPAYPGGPPYAPRTPDGGGLPYGYPVSPPLTPGGLSPRPSLLPDDAGLEPGTLLGKYQIVCKLGSGGMGSVYEAVHVDIGKPVALKTLASRLASEPRAQARFLREAAASSRLSHPNVVDVTDFGAEGGITFIVMELLRGEDLGALVAREAAGMPLDGTADILLAVCAGVFAAHQVGVIHRDLKPQNIFLAHTAIGDVVPKVLDFGISKLLDEATSPTLTGTGTVMGTTPYLSPEQVAGHPIDGRSDQYTLGVILYECVTGRRPHDGEGLFAIMRSIAEGRFVRPRQLRPDLPPAFEAVILRAMGSSPDRRYESVHALGQALLPFATPRGRVIWGGYFTSEQGAVNTAPLPSGHDGGRGPSPRHDAFTPGGRPLPSTHTGDGRSTVTPTPPPRFGTAYEPVLRGRRWPTVLGMLGVVAILVGGGWWTLRSRLPPWAGGHDDGTTDTFAPGAEPTTYAPPRNPVPVRPPPAVVPESPPVEPPPRPSEAVKPPSNDDPVWPTAPRPRAAGAEGDTADQPARATAHPLVPRPVARPPRRRPVRVRPPSTDPDDAPILP
jgi:serine/threonine protein kinase